MFAKTFATVSILAVTASATTVTVLNNCASAVDPAFFPAVTRNGTSTGGFVLASKAASSVTLPSGYSGRIWARTGCNASGVCTTGQCPGGVNCTGPSTTGPTLAQFTINGFSSLDFFNPSTADGFNVVVTITPGSGCTTAPVHCGKDGTGQGCGQTSTCPTGTAYTVSFC